MCTGHADNGKTRSRFHVSTPLVGHKKAMGYALKRKETKRNRVGALTLSVDLSDGDN